MTNNEKIVITAEELEDSDPQATNPVKQELDTSKLPGHPIDFIHDQRTYDLFRLGVSFRSAIEMAMKNGKERPDEIDMVTAFENAKSIQLRGENDGLFNQAAFDARVAEMATTYEDFDPKAPLPTTLELNSHQELGAVMAGLYGKGNLHTASQRKTIIEGGTVDPNDVGDLDEIFEGIALAGNEQLPQMLKYLPTIGGIQKAAFDMVQRSNEKGTFLGFSNLGETVAPDYFQRIRQHRDEVREFEARQKMEQAFTDTEPSKAGSDVGTTEVSQEEPIIAPEINQTPEPVADVPADIVGEAASAARRTIIQEQIDQMKSGENVQTVFAPIPKPAEMQAEADGVEEQEEVDAEAVAEDPKATPEEEFNSAFAAAIESPDALMRALQAPAESEGGAELKRELQKLVDTYKEVQNAQKSEAVWEKVIAPELSKISREDTEVMVQSLRETYNFLMEATQGCEMLRHAVFNGYQDGILDATRRMPVRASEILERISSGSYFVQRAQYEAAAHKVSGVDFRALAEHEEVKKLSTRNQELTSEDAAELHTLLMRAGGQPQVVSVVKNRLVAEMPDSDSWRRKLDTVQQIAQYARRINMNALSSTVSGHVRVVIDKLGYFVSNAQNGRYDGEALNTATMQLSEIADEFNGAQQLARLLQNMAEYA